MQNAAPVALYMEIRLILDPALFNVFNRRPLFYYGLSRPLCLLG